MRAYINNKPFDFDQEITILEAARQMGFFIHTLCAFKPLCHTPGTCAVCIVRVKRADGQELTLTSCKTPLEDGMEVDTISTQVKDAANPSRSDFCRPRYGLCYLRPLRQLRAFAAGP